MKRFVVIISILGVVLFATPGCKPKGSNESAGGSADSADAVPESPIPLGAGPNTNVPASNLVPAPALGAFSALGLFHFEENSLSDNAINQIDSYPISPKLATVVPASHGTGVSFGQDINNRYELFLKSKQISDTDIFKFEADLSLSGEYAHKQRLPVLSSAGGSEVQWDWGVIFLGESVHQYYRIYTEDGKVLEARSGALVEMNKQNRSSEVPLFTHISVTLKAASVVFSSGIDSNDVTANVMEDDQDKVDQGEEDKSFLAPGCLEKRSFCDNEQKNEESLLTYRFGWNSFGDVFIGIIDELQISREQSTP